MVLYVGETLVVRVKAKNPLTGKAVTPPGVTCSVEFFVPAKDPARVVTDRTPDHTFSVPYDTEAKAFIAYIVTATWEPGLWKMRSVLAGDYASWEYSAIELNV